MATVGSVGSMDKRSTSDFAEGVPTATALVGGEWTRPDRPPVDIHSPADGALVSRVVYSSEEEVNAAVAAARDAQKEWAATPLVRRAALLHDAASAIEHRADEICRYVSLEMGKTIRDAREEVVLDITV